MTGFDVRLKAEMFQRVGSYKIRGPLNKFALMPEEQKRRGVVCSSAGNHAQGVALAAKIHGIRAVVCMATNATPAKIAATQGLRRRGRAARQIWDEANEKAKELVRDEGLTYVHPFDDEQLIAGQGTLGLEIVQDWPEVDAVVVPIGGGGLISGVSMAVKSHNPKIRVIGVESSDGPAMQRERRSGPARDDRLPHDHRRPARAARGRAQLLGRAALRRRDRGAARPRDLRRDDLGDGAVQAGRRRRGGAPVAALLHGLVKLPAGSRVAVVLSGRQPESRSAARTELELSRAFSSPSVAASLLWRLAPIRVAQQFLRLAPERIAIEPRADPTTRPDVWRREIAIGTSREVRVLRRRGRTRSRRRRVPAVVCSRARVHGEDLFRTRKVGSPHASTSSSRAARGIYGGAADRTRDGGTLVGCFFAAGFFWPPASQPRIFSPRLFRRLLGRALAFSHSPPCPRSARSLTTRGSASFNERGMPVVRLNPAGAPLNLLGAPGPGGRQPLTPSGPRR